jgi:predicted nucleotidyltransferase
MGVCIEPPVYVIGHERFEQHVWRSQPEGVRSQHGDTDRVVYSLRKWTMLAQKGNPSALVLLFSPDPLVTSEVGMALRGHADWFASKRALRAFLGYQTRQRERLMGTRGQTNVKRPELVAEHGFDTKYAMHMLRLGFQGVEYGSTGRLELPMSGETREYLLGVRRGEVSAEAAIDRSLRLSGEIEELIATGWLPDDPEYDRINNWLVEAYHEYWQKEGWL